MDSLPPTIADGKLLALLGHALGSENSAQSNQALRIHLFQPSFSWQRLVDLACGHGLLPALIFSLRRRRLLPPLPPLIDSKLSDSHVTLRLEAAYLEHLNRQGDLRDQLVKALRALNRVGVVPMLLKGALHLTLPQSDWHEARGMRDLDILVSSRDAQTAARTLVSLGYLTDEDPPPLDRHLPEMHLPGRAGAIEIHTEALSFNARRALSTKEVWSYAERRSFDGASFFYLPREWHLLHGFLHHQIADRGHARRMLALKGLWEFANIGREISPSGWEAIIAHAEERDIFTSLSSWAAQANRLFGLRSPAILLASASGINHADATFKRAYKPMALRQAFFFCDKLSFAFAPSTMARRYGRASGAAALRHIAFLWRRRGPAARRWLGR